jgi:hypothetical protein
MVANIYVFILCQPKKIGIYLASLNIQREQTEGEKILGP